MDPACCSRSVVYKRTFDISVQLLVGMQVLQSQQQLADNNGNVVLADQAGLHEVGAAATGAKLHDDPELGALGVGAIVLGDVGALQLGEDGDFLDNVLNLVLGVFNVNDFDGDGLAGALVDAVCVAALAWFLAKHRSKRCRGREPYPLYTLPKLPPPMQYSFE